MGIKSTDKRKLAGFINKVLDGKMLSFVDTTRTGGGSNAVIRITATGGTISTPGDGFRYHIFTTPGTFSVSNGLDFINVVAIGGGGSEGGSDAGPGGGGAGGGSVLGTFLISSGTYTVAIGGGGSGQTAGANGGGTGGNAGLSGNSGGGGGGGGWSGFYTPSAYFVVAGGGAGGGGANEGPANDQAAFGGGSPSNTYRTDSLTGSNGSPYGPGDGGGWGGSGGGFNGITGGGGIGGTSQSGGSNYINPQSTQSLMYAGTNGSFPSNGGGPGAPVFLSANPSWSPVIPAPTGNGGSGSGQNGIVVVRYRV